MDNKTQSRSGSSPSTGLVVAIDAGGTKLAGALISPEGAVVARVREQAAKGSLAKTVEQVAGVVGELAGAGQAQAIGLIVPGIWNSRDGTAWAPNLWGSEHVPLLEALQQKLSLPVAIASDRTGSVLAEAWLGSARGLQDVVFVAIGTGIGAGILSGGRVIEGPGGIAGAIGWMAITDRWRPEYESCGCLEYEGAGPSLTMHMLEWGSSGEFPPEVVSVLAREGLRDARAALQDTARALGRGIANLVSTLNPELVVIGGGLVEEWDLLEAPLREEFTRWAQPVAASQVRFAPSALRTDAGLFGAARIALDLLARGRE